MDNDDFFPVSHSFHSLLKMKTFNLRISSADFTDHIPLLSHSTNFIKNLPITLWIYPVHRQTNKQINGSEKVSIQKMA